MAAKSTYCEMNDNTLLEVVSHDVWSDIFCSFLLYNDFISINVTCKHFNNLTNPNKNIINKYWEKQCKLYCNNIHPYYKTKQWNLFFIELRSLIIIQLTAILFKNTSNKSINKSISRLHNIDYCSYDCSNINISNVIYYWKHYKILNKNLTIESHIPITLNMKIHYKLNIHDNIYHNDSVFVIVCLNDFIVFFHMLLQISSYKLNKIGHHKINIKMIFNALHISIKYGSIKIITYIFENLLEIINKNNYNIDYKLLLNNAIIYKHLSIIKLFLSDKYSKYFIEHINSSLVIACNYFNTNLNCTFKCYQRFMNLTLFLATLLT